MIKGDYRPSQRKTKSGQMVKDKIVVSTTGVEYAIGPRLGQGGVAKVYHAYRVSDHFPVVFKEYVPGKTLSVQKAHRTVKRNIKNLMESPLTDEKGNRLKSFVGPLDQDSLIELPASHGFGYIMEKVDLSEYHGVLELRHKEKYPDARILCKACWELAYLFRRLHLGKGWCYKDVNEGNIFFNCRTGEVRVIDCDNIGVQSARSILGTDGFIAPEIYQTETPDTYSDYFSLAVILYRLFIGGFPMDGKATLEYMTRNNLCVQECGREIYGSRALFAFDPRDQKNTIRGLVDPRKPTMYQSQCFSWDNLPQELRDRFIQTFSVGLSNANRTKRTSDMEWMQTFEKLEKDGLVKCRCGKIQFGDPSGKAKCMFCGKELPKLKRPVPPPPPRPTPKPTPKPTAKPTPKPTAKPTPKPTPHASTPEPTTITFSVLRDVNPSKLTMQAKRNVSVPGSKVHPKLMKDGWMKIQYNPSRKLIAALNDSPYTWTVTYQGAKSQCAPGARAILKPGMVITVLPRQLQLTVREIK